MNKLFPIATLILTMTITGLLAQNLTTPVKSAPYKITWSQCFGGSAQDIGFSLCESDTSELLVSSYTYSNNGTITTPVHGDADWWAMKFTHSTTPQLVWSYTYGGTLYDKLRQMTPSYNKKSYALFGTSHSKNGDVDKSQLPAIDKDNWWLVKINNAGTILKQKLIVGASNGENGGRSILPTPDNGYILLGWSNAQDNDFAGDYSSATDGWLFKVDSNLNIQWKNHYGGTGSDDPIRLIRAGNFYYFTGFTTSNNFNFLGQNHHTFLGHATQDFGVWKTDTLGNLIWAKSPGGTGIEFPFDIHADWDGNIVCAGYTTSNDGDVTGNHGGSKDGWLFKLRASDGSLMWEKCFGGPSLDAIKRILPMPDHGFTLLCTSSSRSGDISHTTAHGGKDVWLLRIDSSLNVMYSKLFGGSDSEDAFDFQEIPGQGYLIFSSTSSSDGDLQGVKSPTNQEDDWLFFVTDSSLFNTHGPMKTTGNVMQIAEALHPASIIVYPSATSGPVFVQSAVALGKNYTIRVMNIAGDEIWSKVVTEKNSPVNQKIDLSQYTKGAYLIQILYDDGTKEVHKIMLQ